jgi:hypothetical protein
MTITTKLLCAAAATGFVAMIATAPAQALTVQECSSKYQAAKTAGTLNGQKWNDFRKTQCTADATPAAAPAGLPPPMTPPPAAQAKPPAAAPMQMPMSTGNAIFPMAVDPKFASEKPHMQRMHTCSQQWQMNKANNTTGGMHWNQKGGGGFYSVCNSRLKGAA